jgi:hypothetical protein
VSAPAEAANRLAALLFGAARPVAHGLPELLLAGLIASLVAACGGAPPAKEPLSASSELAAPAPLPPPAQSGEEASHDASTAKPQLAALPPPEAASEAGPPATPGALIGFDRVRLQSALGQPSLKRVEAPAEIWQYTAQACVMDIYFYEADKQPGIFAVSYVEVRPLGPVPVTEQDCLHGFLAAQASARTHNRQEKKAD